MSDETGCPHCPDGHANPRRRPWGVYVGPERDGDGQPTTLHVGPSNGAHVAESDAEWLRDVIRGDNDNAAQIIDEILAPLKAQIGVAEYEAGQARQRADRAEAANARARELIRRHFLPHPDAEPSPDVAEILAALDEPEAHHE
jgi:hypothetical protein